MRSIRHEQLQVTLDLKALQPAIARHLDNELLISNKGYAPAAAARKAPACRGGRPRGSCANRLAFRLRGHRLQEGGPCGPLFRAAELHAGAFLRRRRTIAAAATIRSCRRWTDAWHRPCRLNGCLHLRGAAAQVVGKVTHRTDSAAAADALRAVFPRDLLRLAHHLLLCLALLGLADHLGQLLLVGLHLQRHLHLAHRDVLAVAAATCDDFVEGEEQLEGVLAHGCLVYLTWAVLLGGKNRTRVRGDGRKAADSKCAALGRNGSR